jgi:class 3 adenylate cyclase/alpha-beta hydrolase superfamily lysophospholipase
VAEVPETQYTKSGDVHIAYQVLGDGPFDLVFVPGLVNHLDLMWEDPRASRFFNGLASFCRLILFDKRGTGLSDRDVGNAGIEERMDDVRAVMDAAGSDRAALFGYSEGGPMSILFAATFPARVNALVLAATFAKLAQTADYPCGRPLPFVETFTRLVEERWGTGDLLDYWAPGLSGHERAVASVARWERMSGSPSSALAILRFVEQIDVRPVLPSIQVPTMIVQRTGDRVVSRGQGRYLAEHIPNARYVEQEGDAHILWLGDIDGLLGEVEEFLTGTRTASDVDRVLTTVLFTDIVGSTDKATELGDRRWRQRLDQYDALVQRQLERFRGRKVNTTGDGTVAAFDGPARAVKCASAIEEAVQGLDLHIRAGLHTGEVELRGDDMAGIAVHVAARVQAMASPSEVLVSSTVKDLVAGSGIELEDRGSHELKGLPDSWRLFAVKA